MPRVALPLPAESNVTLHEALAKRKSAHNVIAEPLPLPALGTILHTLSENDRGTRRYPSGGAKYPIETYLLVQRVEGLERGAYHYHPHSHALEHLWDIPEPLDLFVNVNSWAEKARAVLIFTAGWWKNNDKYQDFGYLLGMLEAGHAAQNVILAASAVDVPTCPLGGFNDDVAASLLDLDLKIEQPIYALTLN